MKEKIALRISGYASIFLLLSYLVYFLNQIDTSLIYYWQQSIAKPFSEAIQYPGGLSELLSALLIGLFAKSFTGSVCLTILVLGLFIFLSIVFRSRKNKPLFFVLLSGSLIPAFFLFADYKLPLHLFTDIFVAILLAALHTIYSPKNSIIKFIYVFVSGALIYLLAGVPGLIIFIQINFIRIILSREYFDLISILSLALIPFIYLPFNLSYSSKLAFFGTFLSLDTVLPAAYYIFLFIPVVFFLSLIILNYFFAKILIKWPALISWAFAAIILSALILVTRPRINEIERNTLRMEQASFNKEWEKVLHLSTNLTSLNKLMQFEINRALGNNGKLLESLFWTPQPFAEKGIFLEHENYTSRLAIHMSDFYYDIGYASETRHWATEAQMVLMRHPIVLRNLIVSSIAQDDVIYAKKYLSILSRSSHYKVWCDNINKKLVNNSVNEDPDIDRLMVNNPEKDFFAGNSNPTLKLSDFYINNKDNYLAFQFLIASYLLQNQIEMVVEHLDDFNRFGIKVLPRNVEEAVVIYMMNPNVENAFLENYTVSRKTMTDFQDFNKLMIASKNMDDAKIKVSKYRMTYWYYYLFTSPYRSK